MSSRVPQEDVESNSADSFNRLGTPLSSDCWSVVFSHLQSARDLVSLIQVCKMTHHVSLQTSTWALVLQRLLGGPQVSSSFSKQLLAPASATGGQDAKQMVLQYLMVPRWAPSKSATATTTGDYEDTEFYRVEALGRGWRLTYKGRDVTLLASRPFRHDEVCYWEIFQRGRRGARLGLYHRDDGSNDDEDENNISGSSHALMSDLWQIGWALCSGGESYICGKSRQPGSGALDWRTQFRQLPPLLSESPHSLGSYERDRGFDNRLLGFRYDGTRDSLDLYCNRAFVGTVFDRLPKPVYAAASCGTGPTVLEVRFFGPVVPTEPFELDQYSLE